MRETQRFLNWFNKPQTLLIEDGVIGRLSNIQIGIAIEKLKNKFQKENLIWNDNFNFIGIRTDNDIDCTFEDWFIVTMSGTLIALPASTVSGTQGIFKYANLWIRGRQGVGTIVENQQIDYLLVEPRSNNQWTMWTGGLGFLFQDKPISVYRGAVKQGNTWVINKNNIVHNDLGGGFNVHSWLNYFLRQVSNLSEGCQVCQANYWNILFPILRRNAINNRIVYTLLQ